MKRTPSGVQEVGKVYNQSALTVTDTPQEVTLTTGRNSIEFVPGPAETNEIYYGGSSVDSNDGAPIMGGKIFSNCKTGFSIYLVCASGQTANVRRIEYD